jgi:2-oxoglutarate ferredoxin oxidoreductase subunit beta
VVALSDPSRGALLVHDEQREDPTLAMMLDRMTYPEMPVPIGVFRAIQRPLYEEKLAQQIDAARARKAPDIEAVLRQGDTWTVPG